jgi:hypothetical protein
MSTSVQKSKKSGSSSGVFKDPKALRVKVDAEFYRIISGGLYSDPIKAIVREYGANALDAHIQANNPNPFEVHVPSKSEPYFIVRDFGSGLTEEEMFSIWGTYFASNKKSDNAQTGFFGLGSKSAISIYSTFTVTSYKDGKMLRCVVQTDDEGVPQFLEESKPVATEEPSGLKIHIPVAQKDVTTFQNKIREVYQYFPLKPKLVGDAVFEIVKPAYERTIRVSDDLWVGFRESNYDCEEKSQLIFGGIAYPCDLTKAEDIDFYVPNGVFTPVPSREAIVTNKKAESSFQDIIDQVFAKWKELNAAIMADTTISDYERVCRMSQLGSFMHDLDSSASDLVIKPLTKVVSKYDYSDSGDGFVLGRYENGKARILYPDMADCCGYSFFKQIRLKSKGVFESETRNIIDLKDVVIVDVNCSRWKQRYTIWSNRGTFSSKERHIELSPLSLALKERAGEYGIDIPLVKLSEIALPARKTPSVGKSFDSSPKDKTAKKKKSPRSIGCFYMHTGSVSQGYHSSVGFYTTSDISEAKYFVALNEDKSVARCSERQPNDLQDYLRVILLSLGLHATKEVIGIKSSKISLYPHLRSFNELLEERKKVFLESPNVAMAYLEECWHHQYRDYQGVVKKAEVPTVDAMVSYWIWVKGNTESLDGTENPFVKFLLSDSLSVVEERSEPLYEAMCGCYSFKMPQLKKTIQELLAKWKELLKVCPYLAYTYKNQIVMSVNSFGSLINQEQKTCLV